MPRTKSRSPEETKARAKVHITAALEGEDTYRLQQILELLTYTAGRGNEDAKKSIQPWIDKVRARLKELRSRGFV